MALDFSGYVPGMVNRGPAYVPPTIAQQLVSLKAMIQALQKQLADLDPEELRQTIAELRTALTLVRDDIDALQDDVDDVHGDIAAINQTLDTLEDTLTGIARELDNKADESTVTALSDDLNDMAADVETLETALTGKADGNSTGAALMSAGIPYGEVDSTSTSTVYTATVPGITELTKGTVVLLKNGVVTSATGFTVNINGLGAKPVYSSMSAATAESTIFNIAYTLLLIYDPDRVAGGCWINYRGYNSNDNTIGYQIRTNSSTWVMLERVYRYRLLFESAADPAKLVPANTSTSTNTTSARTPSTSPINPFGVILYYGATTGIMAGSAVASNSTWMQIVINIRYSFMPVTLTEQQPVYLKCRPQASGGAVIDPTTPIVQTLPTSADGYIYIYLGQAYSTTSFELSVRHPVYCWRGGGIKQWDGTVETELLAADWDISGSLSSATLTEDVSGYSELEITVKGPVTASEGGIQRSQYRTFKVPVSEGGFVIYDWTETGTYNKIAIGWSGTTISSQNTTNPLTTGYTVTKVTARN